MSNRFCEAAVKLGALPWKPFEKKSIPLLAERNPWAPSPPRSQAPQNKPLEKQMRPRPATGAACFVIALVSASSLPEAARRWLPVRQRSRGVPLLPVPAAAHGSESHAPQPPQRTSRPTRSKSAKWRRPQCPGKRQALARYQVPSGNSRFENCQLPPASPQSSFDRLQRSHVWLNTLSGRISHGAIKIPPGGVQKLWRMSVPCGRLRKRPGKLWQLKSRANRLP